MQSATHYKWLHQWKICHNFQRCSSQPGLNRHMKINSSLSRGFRSEEWPEKTSASVRIEPATLRSTTHNACASDSSVLRSSGLIGALVKWLFGRITLRRSPFFVAEVWTRPLKGISIQTAPAPLLGLQHAANVPGHVGQTLISLPLFKRVGSITYILTQF